MSQTIINDNGDEVVVYSQEEIDAQIAAKEAALKAEFEKQLAEKDEHVKLKLDQFQQATKSVDKEKEEVRTMAEEAKRIAEEAKLSVQQSKESELGIRKDFWIQSVAGNDPDLKKKIEDAYSIINLPSGTDKEIAERVQKAVTLAGISQVSTPSLSFGGAQAPNFQQAGEQSKAAEHEAWKKELGITL